MTLALFRRRRPAPTPPPSCPAVASGVLTEDQAAELRARLDEVEAAIARRAAWPARCAVPAVPRDPEPRPGALGYVVAVRSGGRVDLTHASLMSVGEAHAEARQWRRGPGRRNGLTYEVWPVGGRP